MAPPIFSDVFENPPPLMIDTPPQPTDDATGSGPAALSTMPLELTSKIIKFTYYSDPVSAVCLALTCHYFKGLITSTFKMTLSEFVPRSCDCWACKTKKSRIMSYMSALELMRRDISTFDLAFVRLELMRLIMELWLPNHPMPEKERLRSLLNKD